MIPRNALTATPARPILIRTGSQIRHKHPGARRALVAVAAALALSVLAWIGVAALLG